MTHDPVAIIGIGCRMPGGVHSPAGLWDLLIRGTDAVTEMPADRFDLSRLFDPDPSSPGHIYTRWGGFLDRIGEFDAAFFGISPREAVHIDPQHRLLLETTWEAFEDAGLPPDRAAATSTGVFVGMSTHDYGDIQMYPANRLLLDHHSNTGTAVSIAANRLSYCFDLRGPSLAVDTACSSALTAVHLACTSLRAGECGLAVAGGVHIMLTAEPTMGFCRATMLSPTGRCRAFDARGDGYVRSEGVGVVILKPLSAALADGDAVYAVIRGTAINQDGRSAGLTVPSGTAHEAMLLRALEAAGVEPREVQYVEAHGTGTPVGDPIEARAIGAVMGADRAAGERCAIGSIKTNIGHLEAASGIAGLIKTALALSHRQIPASLHFERPNPSIDLDALRLRVVTSLEPWPAGPGEGVAGVNSFGFGGANAHVVLGEAPAALRRSNGRPADVREAGVTTHDGARLHGSPAHAQVVTLSARSDASLNGLAHDYVAHIGRTPHISLNDLSAATAMQRAHHAHRLAIVGTTRDEIVEGLEAFVAGDARANVASGRVPVAPSRLAFVFSGMGTQWWGMARALMRDEPLFREALGRCDRALRPHKGWSVVEQLTVEEGQSRMRKLEVAQVCGFAVQLALVELLASWGIVPDAVVGHSAGELAAAYVAGVHDFDDSVRLVHHRSRLQSRTQGQGRMLAAGVPADDVAPWLARYGDAVSLAAVNAPRSITLSGDAELLAEIERELQARSAFARFVQVDAPFHSAKMDSVRAELAESLRGLRTHPASVALVSTVTGRWTDGTDITPEYWWRNLREPVQFAAGVHTLIENGVRTFLEIGPHPVLAASIRECVAAGGAAAAVFGTLRRDGDDRTNLLRSLAGLYVEGRAIDWPGVVDRARPVSLPTYRWDRARHWFEPADESDRSREWAEATAAADPDSHPLIQRRVPAAVPLWESRLSDARLSWIQAHRIHGAAVFPGAGYVEAAIAAAAALRPGDSVRLTQVEFARVLFVTPDSEERLQVTLDTNRSRVQVYSGSGQRGWTIHASAKIGSQPPALAGPDLGALRARCQEPVDREACYADLAARGLGYGPEFRGLASIWRGENEAVALVTAERAVRDAGEQEGPLDVASFHAHPALLDAAFQLLFVAAPVDDTVPSRPLYLPVRIDELKVYGSLPPRFWVHARARRTGAMQMVGDVRIFGEDGAIVMDVRGLGCQLVDARATENESIADWLYEYGWEPRAVDRAPALEGHIDAVFDDDAIRSLEGLGDAIEAIERRTDYRTYYTVEPKLDDIAVAYIVSALRDLGWRLEAGTVIRWSDVADRIAEARRPFMRRLLGILVDKGRLREEEAGRWIVPVPIETSQLNPEMALASVRKDHPGYATEMALLVRSGTHLSGNLAGDLLATETLFSGETAAAMERFYRDAPSMHFSNLVLAEAMAALAARRTHDRSAEPLRLLEVGGGTGGSTPFLLSALDPLPLTYTFTDVSPVFVERAAARWRDRPSLVARVFDIERSPVDQGFQADHFDVVVAANVVHATADLGATLNHLRSLLAPGGALVLMEITRRPAWLDLIVGLTDGWWRFRDLDLRPDHALLGQTMWQRVLRTAGFDQVVCLSDRHHLGDPGQTVFVARRPNLDASGIGARPWLILADRAGVGLDVSERLAARGRHASIVAHDAAALRARLDVAASAPRGVIHCLGMDLDSPSGDEDGVTSNWLEQQAEASASLVSLVRTLASAGGDRTSDRPELWIVTSGGQPMAAGGAAAQDGEAAIEQSSLWGLGRVLMLEEPEVRCRLIDLDRRPDSRSLDVLVGLIEGSVRGVDEEEELAVRNGDLFVRRLTRAHAGEIPLRRTRSKGEVTPAWRAEIDTPGALQTVTFRAMREPLPGPGEVAVRIEAASINFRDVMLAMGMIPGLESEASFGHQHLGLDAAGTVIACGAGVSDFAPGDPVVAIVPGAFAASSVTRAELAARRPATLTVEQAAAVPCAFVTAHYALNRLAQIRRGERVLIHAATGGVGLAALQIATRAGATVFATAGSPEKRAWLTSRGVDHVMDSRSLAFADEILELTGGEGVDTVLNSLAGEALGRSLGILRPYGRFLEIGKRDIYEDSQLGLLAFRKNLSFFAIDLDRLCAERPALVSEMLREVMDDFGQGLFEPLPAHAFPMAGLEHALRFMAQARHIGKIVLSQTDTPPIVPAVDGPFLREDGTYLVTGGLGGFGLAVAGWMCRQGAGHLVLMGRRGLTCDVEPVIDALRASGARVEVIAGDVSRMADVRSVLDHIRTTLPPLRGVFHAAMVLEDAPLAEMDAARFTRVMAAKMAGAWHLHRETAGMDLDAFVLFSSMSSLLGNPQQANYCAANAFLDALAHARWQSGRPALAINWGVLSEVGYVSHHQAVADFLAKQGYYGFSERQALDVLDWLMRRDVAQMMAGRVDWRRWATASPARAQSPRMRHLVPDEATPASAAAAAPRDLARQLRALDDDAARVEWVEEYLRGKVARILGASAAALDMDRPLTELGTDSLTAVELTTALGVDLGVEVPLVRVLQGASTRSLALTVLEQIGRPPGSNVDREQHVPAPQIAESSKIDPIVDRTHPSLTPSVTLTPPAISIDRHEAPTVRLAPSPSTNGGARWSGRQRWARGAMGLGFRALTNLRVEGTQHLPTDGPYIIAVNHLSLLDAPLVMTVLPRPATLLAAEYLQRSAAGWLLRHFGRAIYVKRGQADRAALDRGIALLRDGGVLALGPEGTRSATGGLGRGLTGVAVVATELGVPVVPLVAWGQERVTDSWKSFRRAPVHVRIGAPLQFPRATVEASQLREYTDRVMHALAALLPLPYRGVYSESSAGTEVGRVE